MKFEILILMLSSFLIVTLAVADDFKGIADVEVYFNDQVATVDNATLRVGEPFTVKTVIVLKKDIFAVDTKLSAAGFKDEEPQPYETITTPPNETLKSNTKFTSYYGELNKKTGDTIVFEWALKPTNVWAGGRAPLDITISFYDAAKSKSYPLSFTVANIYISKETYTGSAAAPSQPEMSVFSIVKTPLAQTPAASVPQKQPGFEVALAVAGLATVVFMMRKKR
jgi:MAST domain-containing protein